MAHQRPQIAPVDAHHAEVAMPAHRIERIEQDRSPSKAGCAASPIPSRCARPAGRGRHRRCAACRVSPDRRWRDVRPRPFSGRVKWSLVASIINENRGLGRLQAPHRAARDHQVVALAVIEVAVVAEQGALAFVDEQELVAVAVARQLGHRLVQPPDAHLQVRVAHHEFSVSRDWPWPIRAC